MNDGSVMACKEFLERYTEYRDGLLSAGESGRFDAHLESCESCRRYESVITRGLAAWRALPRVTTSSDFQPRLQHRLYHVDDPGRRSLRAHVGRAAMIAVGAAGLFTLSVSNRNQPLSVEVQLPPVTADAPLEAVAESQPSLFDNSPYIPGRFLVPFAPALDDAGGLFSSSYDMTIVAGDSTLLLAEPRSGQLDESR